MVKAGMIGFSNNKKGFLPAAIRFFTKSKISHSFVITQDIYSQPAVQEASLLVQVVSFAKYYQHDDTQSYWLYSLTKATQQEKEKALAYCFEKYAGDHYGKLQLLWFVYAWFCMNILRQKKEDVVKRKNWLSDGVICSELQYDYLVQVNPYYASLVSGFNPDTIQAEDLRQIVVANPDGFKAEEFKI